MLRLLITAMGKEAKLEQDKVKFIIESIINLLYWAIVIYYKFSGKETKKLNRIKIVYKRIK